MKTLTLADKFAMWELRARAHAAEGAVPAVALAVLGWTCGSMSGLFTIGGMLVPRASLTSRTVTRRSLPRCAGISGRS